MTVGWKLDAKCREELLAAYPPRYTCSVADHVTLSVFGKEAPQPVDAAFIIARVDDDLGVEAFIVSIAGSTARPDGGTWHITWSLADGRAARESNDVIASKPWAPMPAMALSLYPAHW